MYTYQQNDIVYEWENRFETHYFYVYKLTAPTPQRIDI